jgi:hypothetical protein
MRDVINLPFLDKLLIDRPRCVLDDLVYPLQVSEGLVPFFGMHDGLSFVLEDEFRRATTDEEVDRRECEFALSEL